MNNDQQLVSWLAVFGIIIGVMLVYRSQLSAILFTNSIGNSSAPPSKNDPNGVMPIQPTPAPSGQSGTFGVDPNGNLYKWGNGTWTPWGTTAPGNQPHPAGFDPTGLSGLVGSVV